MLTPPKMAREYFNDVVAPIKQIELIADAGHFAAFLQPQHFLKLLLAHVRPAGESIVVPGHCDFEAATLKSQSLSEVGSGEPFHR